MGTLIKIEVFDIDKEKSKIAINNAFKEIRRWDKILSNYRDDSELSLVLKSAYKYPTKVSDDFFIATERAYYFSELTNGKFDITVSPLVKLWGFKDKDFKVPTLNQINNIKKNIGYKNIILDKDNKTIFIQNKNITLDFGGSGKGLAIGEAVNILKKYDIKSAVIDSVSNQYYLGNDNGKPWKIAIKDPRNKENILKFVDVSDSAVSTSGDYEQFFINNGKRYSHIIDPISGFPIQDSIASTIIYKDSHDADILSTSVLLLDDLSTLNLLKSFDSYYCFKVFKNETKLETKEYIK